MSSGPHGRPTARLIEAQQKPAQEKPTKEKQAKEKQDKKWQ
ncbi:hypothetical protein [Streptomyces sp. NPDC055709]